MRRMLSIAALTLAFMPSMASASLLSPKIGSLVATQADAPVQLLSCGGSFSPISDKTYATTSFKPVDQLVKSVTLRFALLGMDRRVIAEHSYTIDGNYPADKVVNLDNGFFVGKSYADGTALCSISSVTRGDGSVWESRGSDHPWNPMEDVMLGDEPK